MRCIMYNFTGTKYIEIINSIIPSGEYLVHWVVNLMIDKPNDKKLKFINKYARLIISINETMSPCYNIERLINNYAHVEKH